MTCKTCAGPCALKGSNIPGDCEGYKPQTHYEQIKAMSVEEMARFIHKVVEAELWRVQVRECATTEDGWLDWLRQEAEP